MTTYCYRHGLATTGCFDCSSRVAEMLRGDYPFRSDLEPLEVWARFFPQLGDGAELEVAKARRRWHEKTQEERRWEVAGFVAARETKG